MACAPTPGLSSAPKKSTRTACRRHGSDALRSCENLMALKMYLCSCPLEFIISSVCLTLTVCLTSQVSSSLAIARRRFRQTPDNLTRKTGYPTAENILLCQRLPSSEKRPPHPWKSPPRPLAAPWTALVHRSLWEVQSWADSSGFASILPLRCSPHTTPLRRAAK